jgi:hypothetical protein
MNDKPDSDMNGSQQTARHILQIRSWQVKQSPFGHMPRTQDVLAVVQALDHCRGVPTTPQQ